MANHTRVPKCGVRLPYRSFTTTKISLPRHSIWSLFGVRHVCRPFTTSRFRFHVLGSLLPSHETGRVERIEDASHKYMRLGWHADSLVRAIPLTCT